MPKRELAIVRRITLDAVGVAVTVDLMLGQTTVGVPWGDVGQYITPDMVHAPSFAGWEGRGVIVEESDTGHFSFVRFQEDADAR